MKKFLYPLLLAMSVAFTTNADTPTPTPPPPDKTIEGELTPLPPTIPNRPRVPAHVSIHIVFNPLTQECLFGLPDGIDHVSVEVICEQTGFTFYDEVFASDPIAIIPMAPGNNVIVCTTDNGETFSGTLYI